MASAANPILKQPCVECECDTILPCNICGDPVCRDCYAFHRAFCDTIDIKEKHDGGN